MYDTCNRAFADGRQAALVGEGPDRLLDACDRLLFQGADPAALIEGPLLGEPSYDCAVFLHGKQIYKGCRLYDQAETDAQAVTDWTAG